MLVTLSQRVYKREKSTLKGVFVAESDLWDLSFLQQIMTPVRA